MCKVSRRLQDLHLRHALVTCGVTRSQAAPARPPCLSMTIDRTKRICSVLSAHFTNGYERHMLWRAFTLAYFGFFGVGELTSAPNASPPPRLGDISLCIDHLVLRLRSRKADPFHHGCDVVVEALGTDVCGFSAGAEYLRIRSRLGVAWERDTPLFATRADSALIRSTL